MDSTVGGEDWEVLRRFLPVGWEEEARRSGALRRGRGVDGVESLLCVLLMHLLIDRLLAGRNNSACADGGPGSVERRGHIQSAAGLRGMAALAGRRAAEVVWAVHLMTLQCDFFTITDYSGRETEQRLPIENGDIVLANRAYPNAARIVHGLGAGGDVLFRHNW